MEVGVVLDGIVTAADTSRGMEMGAVKVDKSDAAPGSDNVGVDDTVETLAVVVLLVVEAVVGVLAATVSSGGLEATVAMDVCVEGE